MKGEIESVFKFQMTRIEYTLLRVKYELLESNA